MIDQTEFLKKYNISLEKFEVTGLQWAALTLLYDDYTAFKGQLENTAEYLFNSLMKTNNVHSVRYRIKDPEHLIEKIIRKKIESDASNITIDNYKSEVKDLIGLRALHLYKDEWESIHEFISTTWDAAEKPVANYRAGDSPDLTKVYEEKGCELKEHKFGYRSIHYIIVTQPSKTKVYAEIQVRTIFEEGWSEIDHRIRYPYEQNNKLLLGYSLLLNRLAGNADEMGSFIKFMKYTLTERESEFQRQIVEKNNVITHLEERISHLAISEEQMVELKAELEKLKSQQNNQSFILGDNKKAIPFYVPGSFAGSELYPSYDHFYPAGSLGTVLQDWNQLNSNNLFKYLNVESKTPTPTKHAVSRPAPPPVNTETELKDN